MDSPEQSGSDLRAQVPLSVNAAIESVKTALKEQGFGVLTEIHVDQVLQEKIGAAFRPYVILGACNPNMAYQALQQNLEVGLRLPCNVVVYEGDGGGATVAAMDPLVALQGIPGSGPEMEPVARQVRAKLATAIAHVGKS